MKRILLLTFCLSLFLGAAPAMADMVEFIAINPGTYISGPGLFSPPGVVACGSIGMGVGPATSLYVGTADNLGNPLDFTQIDDYAYHFYVFLDFYKHGSNVYSATGQVFISDLGPGPAWPATIEADFMSSRIALVGSALQIEGYLYTPAGRTSILQQDTPGGAWVFCGDPGTGADGDGVVTVAYPNSFSRGTMFVSAYPTGASSLDQLFSRDWTTEMQMGVLAGYVVPVPAAVLLGMIGLGMASVKLRKFA